MHKLKQEGGTAPPAKKTGKKNEGRDFGKTSEDRG